jgi:hypothetical protein
MYPLNLNLILLSSCQEVICFKLEPRLVPSALATNLGNRYHHHRCRHHRRRHHHHQHNHPTTTPTITSTYALFFISSFLLLFSSIFIIMFIFIVIRFVVFYFYFLLSLISLSRPIFAITVVLIKLYFPCISNFFILLAYTLVQF